MASLNLRLNLTLAATVVVVGALGLYVWARRVTRPSTAPLLTSEKPILAEPAAMIGSKSEIAFRIPFRNDSNESVRIEEVISSYTCVGLKPLEREYAPGQAGECVGKVSLPGGGKDPQAGAVLQIVAKGSGKPVNHKVPVMVPVRVPVSAELQRVELVSEPEPQTQQHIRV